MVKSSEFTPVTAALFEEVCAKFFAEDELAFFSGGPDVGQAFAKLPFDHLIFTGATGVGRHILHAAADNLTPVTLELGGKSPVIIGKSADMKQAAERIAIGKMMNAGQICLAPDYLLVPQERDAEIVGEITKAVSVMYPTLLNNDDYTSVVNARHRDRLRGYLDDARAKGGEVVEINPGNEDFAASNGNKMPLYLVRNPTDDMKVMQEEIFGPVLQMVRAPDFETAVRLPSEHQYGNGVAIFTRNGHAAREFAARVNVGMVGINVPIPVPVAYHTFGGWKRSGFGDTNQHGMEGVKFWTKLKTVTQRWPDGSATGDENAFVIPTMG